jgi:hypothetical protein
MLAAAVLTGLAAATLLLTGCGATGGSGTTSPTNYQHPTGPDELVLSVFRGGGLAPAEALFTLLPEFSLYGDGRSITQGPVIAIYPPPALPNLRSAALSEAGIQRVLTATEGAGVFRADVDYGIPGVTDMPTTTFTVIADGSTHVTRIYALDFQGPGRTGLTRAQEQARKVVIDFQAKLVDVRSWLGGEVGPDEAYEFKSLAVLIMPVDKIEPDSSGITPSVVEWPLGPLASLGTPGPG